MTTNPTEILCRLDKNTNKPVVFIAHTMANGQIQMWDGSDDLRFIPLHEYQRTVPLADEDEKLVAKRFDRHFKTQSIVRHRLPRTPQTRRTLFAQPGNPPPAGNNVVALPNVQAALGAPNHQPGPSAATAFLSGAIEIPPSDLPSGEILALIRKEGENLAALASQVEELTRALQQATTAHADSQKSYAILSAQYQVATDREMAEERRKRDEALTNALAPLAELKKLADETATGQSAPATDQQQPEHPGTTNQSAANAPRVRGPGGRFLPAGSAQQPVKQDEILDQFTPEQLEAMVAVARARQGGSPPKK